MLNQHQFCLLLSLDLMFVGLFVFLYLCVSAFLEFGFYYIASEASMGAFYFRERVNGCCNGACGYCYAIGVQHTEVPNQGASW